MNYLTNAVLGLITFSLVGCAVQSKLTYSSLPEEGSEGVGFAFVVPRTVIKVDSVPDKNGATDKVSFATAPVAYAEGGKTTLPRFLAVDSSSAAFSLTPTTISNVTYADELIITAIGTQVTDNRKDAIDAVIGFAALAGKFAAVDCATAPLKPFVLDPVTPTPVTGPAPNNPNCWGYSIKPTEDANPVGMRHYPVKDLASVGQSVAWFPIPACRSYDVAVFRCGKDCTEANGIAFTAVLSVSDGTQYRRVPLPGKGKISLHSDFCQADVTNEAVGTSDWGLLNQAISDVKAAKKK